MNYLVTTPAFLKLEVHSHQTNEIEMRLLGQIRFFIYCRLVDWTSILSLLSEWMEDTSMDGGHNYWVAYRLHVMTNGSLELWYYNVHNRPHRKVCTIAEEVSNG